MVTVFDVQICPFDEDENKVTFFENVTGLLKRLVLENTTFPAGCRLLDVHMPPDRLHCRQTGTEPCTLLLQPDIVYNVHQNVKFYARSGNTNLSNTKTIATFKVTLTCSDPCYYQYSIDNKDINKALKESRCVAIYSLAISRSTHLKL